jgi:hypothetical protein
VSGIIMSVGIDSKSKGIAYKGIAKTFLGFRHLRNGCFAADGF